MPRALTLGGLALALANWGWALGGCELGAGRSCSGAGAGGFGRAAKGLALRFGYPGRALLFCHSCSGLVAGVISLALECPGYLTT